MANIGDQLLNPEAGWRRYDSIDKLIKHNMDIVENSRFHGGSLIYCLNETNDKYVRFSFAGSSLRLIGDSSSLYSKPITIRIDKQEYTYTANTSQTVTGIVLNFEINGLSDSVHDISIMPSSGAYFSLDCIDVNDGGMLMPPTIVIGESLPQPEKGWNRIDDTDSLISYNGEWKVNGSTGSYYNKTVMSIPDGKLGGLVFNALCTSIRFIGRSAPNRADVDVYIDGVKHSTLNQESTNTIEISLDHEITGLNNHVHKIELIKTTVNGHYFFDAIDLNEGGALIPELSKDYEFPVKTIEKADVEAYAATCINGEEQLLIAIEDGSQYLTKGDGTYIECSGGSGDASHVHRNIEVLNGFSVENDILKYKGFEVACVNKRINKVVFNMSLDEGITDKYLTLGEIRFIKEQAVIPLDTCLSNTADRFEAAYIGGVSNPPGTNSADYLLFNAFNTAKRGQGAYTLNDYGFMKRTITVNISKDFPLFDSISFGTVFYNYIRKCSELTIEYHYNNGEVSSITLDTSNMELNETMTTRVEDATPVQPSILMDELNSYMHKYNELLSRVEKLESYICHTK